MISVHGSSLEEIDRTSDLYKRLENFHLRLAKKDSTIWGAKASKEAEKRLNWIQAPTSSKALLPELAELLKKFSELTHIVLCGMGGSSLAPEVFAKSFNKELFVLDSTDPAYIAHTEGFDLTKTLVIVSSKSGSTLETVAARNYFASRFMAEKLDPVAHMLFVTDPDSALDRQARKEGFTVVNADPFIGGRFSALSAFGLVPAVLMNINVEKVLDDAESAIAAFLQHPQAIIDSAYVLLNDTRQFIEFSDEGSELPGMSDWIEQLIAESTGKDSKGRLPIAVDSYSKLDDVLTVSFENEAQLNVHGQLGEHFIFWEWITALIAASLEVDAFNQPNVTEAKELTSVLLQEWDNSLPNLHPDADEDGVEIFGDGVTLTSALKNLIMNTDSDGYIAVMAYLDRASDSRVAELQRILSEKSGRPVTFGWGPRFLHSTGQFHKGGQPNGSFLQITGNTEHDIKIPEMDFDFKTLLAAQAIGDGRALSSRKYPLLRLNLINRSAGIQAVISAAQSI